MVLNDVLEQWKGNNYRPINNVSILFGYHLGLFYKGVSKPIILGQNWKFFLRFCVVEMNKKWCFMRLWRSNKGN